MPNERLSPAGGHLGQGSMTPSDEAVRLIANRDPMDNAAVLASIITILGSADEWDSDITDAVNEQVRRIWQDLRWPNPGSNDSLAFYRTIGRSMGSEYDDDEEYDS